MMTNENSCPILTYHSLDSSGSVISTAPEKFRLQMRNLFDASFTVIKLRDLVGRIHENRELPEKSVAITFDDGFQSVYDVALPVLKDYGYPATVFLVTSFCGKNNRWFGLPDSIPSFDLLTWNQISKMREEQIEFGVHTATHPDLTKLGASQMTDEIIGARQMLQEQTGERSGEIEFLCSLFDANGFRNLQFRCSFFTTHRYVLFLQQRPLLQDRDSFLRSIRWTTQIAAWFQEDDHRQLT